MERAEPRRVPIPNINPDGINPDGVDSEAVFSDGGPASNEQANGAEEEDSGAEQEDSHGSPVVG